MGTRHSGQVYLPTEIQEMLKESGPPAMRDLPIYGKNKLLGLFRAWLEKQIGVKARAGRENPNPNPGRVKNTCEDGGHLIFPRDLSRLDRGSLHTSAKNEKGVKRIS